MDLFVLGIFIALSAGVFLGILLMCICRISGDEEIWRGKQ